MIFESHATVSTSDDRSYRLTSSRRRNKKLPSSPDSDISQERMLTRHKKIIKIG